MNASFKPVTTRRMILIHGAWQGAWAWDFWLPELKRLGWQAEAVNLPGNGCDPADATLPQDVSLQRYVDHVLKIIGQGEEPVVLVGHSGGGLTATAVAEAAPDRVAAVVYLAGMMLPSGVSFADLVRTVQAEQPGLDMAGVSPFLRKANGGSEVPVDAACRIFLHDCEPALARQLAAKLKFQPDGGRLIAPVWTPAGLGAVPRIYVEATEDRSLLLPVQRRMQALVPGAQVISLACGHVPQVVCAAESARLVCDVLVHGSRTDSP